MARREFLSRAGNRLDFGKFSMMICRMRLPSEPILLTVEQIGELNRRLSKLRHDVNNNLSLITASVELIRRRPENSERLLNLLVEQPQEVAKILAGFSADMESALGIKRD
jgi:hypothetical protein